MIEVVLGHFESDLVVGSFLAVGGPEYGLITLFS